MTKRFILNFLSSHKAGLAQKYGVTKIGLFGSYAKDTQNEFSDIDIAYRLDYNKFSQKYVDGFSKLLRIEEMKDELKKIFKKNIDFVPDKNKKILQGIIYVWSKV